MDRWLEFLEYRDRFGLNQPYTKYGVGEVSQNGALFTLEYLIWLINDETISDDIKEKEIERLKEVYRSLESFPGISTRYPNGTEYDSMDNTGAIAIFSGLFDNGRYSKASYEHGDKTHSIGIDLTQDPERNTKFYRVAGLASIIYCLNPIKLFRWIKSGFAPKMYWNNNTPNMFCLPGWHGRSPGHVAILKLTAGKLVGPIGLLSIIVGQFLGCFSEKNNADARKLPYCTWQFLKKRNVIWRLLYKLWCNVLIKQYPNGMQDVYRSYYHTVPEHPIIKYSKPYCE